MGIWMKWLLQRDRHLDCGIVNCQPWALSSNHSAFCQSLPPCPLHIPLHLHFHSKYRRFLSNSTIFQFSSQLLRVMLFDFLSAPPLLFLKGLHISVHSPLHLFYLLSIYSSFHEWKGACPSFWDNACRLLFSSSSTSTSFCLCTQSSHTAGRYCLIA